MIEEFEVISSDESPKHHEQKRSIQGAFAKDVVNMVSSMEQLGNPFNDSRQDLIGFYTKIIDEAVANNVKQSRKVGENRSQIFLKVVFQDKTKPLMDPIKKNNCNFPTFHNKVKKLFQKTRRR